MVLFGSHVFFVQVYYHKTGKIFAAVDKKRKKDKEGWQQKYLTRNHDKNRAVHILDEG